MINLALIGIVVLLFLSIGIYWTVFTGHFFRWTMRVNDKMVLGVDSHLQKPCLMITSRYNYARLQQIGGLALFQWSCRAIGLVLVGFSSLMIYMAVTKIHIF